MNDAFGLTGGKSSAKADAGDRWFLRLIHRGGIRSIASLSIFPHRVVVFDHPWWFLHGGWWFFLSDWWFFPDGWWFFPGKWWKSAAINTVLAFVLAFE